MQYDIITQLKIILMSNKQISLILLNCAYDFYLQKSFIYIFIIILQSIHNHMKNIIIVLYLLFLVFNQKCQNSKGTQVDWWVIFKSPASLDGGAYGYYDSSFTTAQIIYTTQKVDNPFTPLFNTLNQINSMKLQFLAWNDQFPNGTVYSSDAHSKALIAISIISGNGIFIDHSLPKYPLINKGVINATINDSQNIYGQHIMCLSLPLTIIESIAQKIMLIKPHIYFSSITSTTSTKNLYTLSLGKFNTSTTGFQYLPFIMKGSTSIKSIYKNPNVNNSIFQDGLNHYLQTNLIVESWGRPLDSSWCGKTYPVTNARQIQIANKKIWQETQDHSKWAVGGKDWACFGDMNRMTSQFKRGGAFYCIESLMLSSAMNSMILVRDTCMEINLRNDV